MNTQKQISALQEAMLKWGDDVAIESVKVSDILESLQELVQIQTMLDEFEDALRDIFRRVKETGVE